MWRKRIFFLLTYDSSFWTICLGYVLVSYQGLFCFFPHTIAFEVCSPPSLFIYVFIYLCFGIGGSAYMNCVLFTRGIARLLAILNLSLENMTIRFEDLQNTWKLCTEDMLWGFHASPSSCRLRSAITSEGRVHCVFFMGRSVSFHGQALQPVGLTG